MLHHAEGKRLQDAFHHLVVVHGLTILIEEVLGCDLQVVQGEHAVGADLLGGDVSPHPGPCNPAAIQGGGQDPRQGVSSGEVIRDALQDAEVREGELHIVVGTTVIGLLIEFGVKASGPIEGLLGSPGCGDIPVHIEPDLTGLDCVEVGIGPVSRRLDGQGGLGRADDFLQRLLLPLDGEGLVIREGQLPDREDLIGFLEYFAPPMDTFPGEEVPGISEGHAHRLFLFCSSSRMPSK